MQKTFEKHWTQADRAEASGNTQLALDWLQITRRQLDADARFKRPSILKAIADQEQRLRRKMNPGMHSGVHERYEAGLGPA